MVIKSNFFVLLFVSFALSGCGLKYDVTHVDAGRDAIADEAGIYYTLPKTEVLISVPVTKKTITYGKYFGKWKKCESICAAEPTKSCPINKQDPVKDVFVFGDAEIQTRSVADLDHLYRLSVDFGAFHSGKHEVEITEDGVLTAGTTTVENFVPEMIVNTMKSVSKALLGVATREAEETVSCAQFYQDKSSYDDYKAAQAALQAGLKNLMENGLSASVPVAEYVAFLDKHKSALARHPGVTVELNRRKTYSTSSTIKLVAIAEPEEGELYSSTRDCPWRLRNEVAWADIEAGDQASSGDGRVAKGTCRYDNEVVGAIMKSTNLRVEIEPSPFARCENECPKLSGKGGYRYRLAGFGKVAIQAETSKNSDYRYEARRIPIAQYGPIAMLPAKIKGRKASISLDTHATTGSIKRISIGTEAVSSNVPSEVVNILGEQRAAHKDKENAQALKEIQKLTNERDRLLLEKEIRELQ